MKKQNKNSIRRLFTFLFLIYLTITISANTNTDTGPDKRLHSVRLHTRRVCILEKEMENNTKFDGSKCLCFSGRAPILDPKASCHNVCNHQVWNKTELILTCQMQGEAVLTGCRDRTHPPIHAQWCACHHLFQPTLNPSISATVIKLRTEIHTCPQSIAHIITPQHAHTPTHTPAHIVTTVKMSIVCVDL